MPTFSFDIVSDYDKAELINVFTAAERELANRYDFKGSSAALEWLDDKSGFKLTGDGDWQIDALLDIIRKKLAGRGQSSKVLDLSKDSHTSNLKTTKEIPFKKGISQEQAKVIAKELRENLPKLKTQIQGELIRVTSSSKDDLQQAIQLLDQAEYDASLQYINYR